jgi:hypothetical protein
VIGVGDGDGEGDGDGDGEGDACGSADCWGVAVELLRNRAVNVRQRSRPRILTIK